MAEVGTGATFALANAPVAFFADVLSFDPSGAERPSIDVSTLATVGGREFVPGNLVDWGSVDLELLLDPTATPPLLTAAGATTITWADGSIWTWDSGFAMSFAMSNPLEDRVTATMSVKLSGDLVIT